MWNTELIHTKANGYPDTRQFNNEEEAIENWLNKEFSINEWLEREEAMLEYTDMTATSTLPQQPLTYIDLSPPEEQVPVLPSASTPYNQISNASSSAYVTASNAYTQQPVPRNDSFLRPCNELPIPYSDFFKFGVFNKMQSACIDDAFYSDSSLAISAPTGSGKTVIMELAIIRLFLKEGSNSKIIYMAPTKSLCNQKFEEWEKKFKPYKINSQLFTGDTDELSIDSLRESQIIITTPEKWDNSTRKWKDHRRFVEMIKLFLIDEVHILNEQRGSVLEACVSRMKSAHKNVRFIAVSATVPNVDDVAAWLNAKQLSFSEEYRPIQLQRFIYGYKQEENMFSFERKLAWKLLEKIQKHSDGKSTLIFCATRASCQTSCETLILTMERNNVFTLGQQNTEEYTFKNKLLNKFAKRGVLFHHAGLSIEDRRQVERLFSEKKVRVIATTSTLAVGVNLPAYMVIIKSTQGYQDGKLSEYTDINFLQMVGRAGRPGLDTSGCVVIMTTNEMENHYKLLVSGTANLESNLHTGLTEHLMSEIYLGTVNGKKSGLEWLFSTFLFVRALKNPSYYKFECSIDLQLSTTTSSDILSDLLMKNMDILERNKLIIKASDGTITHTEYGGIMSRYYIKLETMISIINSPDQLSVKDTLLLVSNSHEMRHIRINSGEKTFLNSLKKHPDVQFPLEKIVTTSDKIFIILQCVLGDISLYAPGVGLATESGDILRNATRTTKCLIDCAIYERNPSKLKFSLQLYQSLLAKVWSNSAFILKQIRGIGQQKAKVLVQSNIVNFKQLRECDPGKIEMILHRNPPFGIEIKKVIDSIPDFVLKINQSLVTGKNQKPFDSLILNIEIKLANEEVVFSKNKLGMYCQFWVETNFNELIDFRRILISKLFKNPQSFKLKIPVQSSDMEIYCHLQSENYVGIDVHETILPKVDPRKYIDIAGASNVPIQKHSTSANKENKNKGQHIQDDDMFDDDIDPEEWKQLADTIHIESTVKTPLESIPKTTNTPVIKQPKKQAKSKRVRKIDTSTQKPKKRKPNKTKDEKNKEKTVSPKSNQSILESFLPSTSTSKDPKSKNSPLENGSITSPTHCPRESTLELDFGTIDDDELNITVDAILEDMKVYTANHKIEKVDKNVESKNQQQSLSPHPTPSSPQKSEQETDIFGNVKISERNLSDSDTIFAGNEDYYFEKSEADPCSDFITNWLKKNVKIVSDGE